jgi:hypothetical protein
MNDLDDAKRNVTSARQQLAHSAAKLRARLAPQSLASDALALARKRGKQVVISAAASAKMRPLLAVGMIAAGVSYLIRKPILTMVANRLAKEKKHDT